jgi:hypothetical protein
VRLTPAQRRVLVALCRPFRDAVYASPASNRQIVAELVVGVDAVKARLKELFDAFGIAALPRTGSGRRSPSRRCVAAPCCHATSEQTGAVQADPLWDLCLRIRPDALDREKRIGAAPEP